MENIIHTNIYQKLQDLQSRISSCKENLQNKFQMEESVFHQEKLWKEVLSLSVILTQLKSIMIALPVKVAQHLANQN